MIVAARKQALETLHRLKAMQSGHYVLSSGRHSDRYVNLKNVPEHYRAEFELLCKLLAEPFCDRPKDSPIDAVIGPANSGNYWSKGVAAYLTAQFGMKVHSVRTVKKPYGFAIHSEDHQIMQQAKHILVVEDVTETGRSVEEILWLCIDGYSLPVAGISVVFNRGDAARYKIGRTHRFHALVNWRLDSWEPDECPLCESGIPTDACLGHNRATPNQPASV